MEIIDLIKNSVLSNDQLIQIAANSSDLYNYVVEGSKKIKTMLLSQQDALSIPNASLKLTPDVTSDAIKEAISKSLAINDNGDLVVKSMRANGPLMFSSIPSTSCYTTLDEVRTSLDSLNELTGFSSLNRDDEDVLIEETVKAITSIKSQLNKGGLDLFIVDKKKSPNSAAGIQDGVASSSTSKGSYGAAIVFRVAPTGSKKVGLHITWQNLVRDAIAVEALYSNIRKEDFSLDRFSKYIAHVANESGGQLNISRFEMRLLADYSKNGNKVTSIKGLKQSSGPDPLSLFSGCTSVGLAQNIMFDPVSVHELIVNLLHSGGVSLTSMGVNESGKAGSFKSNFISILAGLSDPHIAGLVNYVIFIHDYNKRSLSKGSYWASYAGYSETPTELKKINDATDFNDLYKEVSSHKFIAIWLSKASYQLQVIKSIITN